MKTKLALIIVFFSFNAFTESKVYIISGYDDVLRQANNTGLIQVSLNAFSNDKTFVGMPTLYQSLSPKFFLVSAISKLFEKRIEKFLTYEGYPEHERFLRNWTTEWSIQNFKMNVFGEIFNNHIDDKFIVILDNSTASLNFANLILEKFPEKVIRIYIRQVVSRDSILGTIPFYTSFDIALNEYRSNNLSLIKLEEIAAKVLATKTRDELFPKYAICPKNTDCEPYLGDVKALCNKVSFHIKKTCDAM